jgi:enoyl-CoA hydratase/carnithine racemase
VTSAEGAPTTEGVAVSHEAGVATIVLTRGEKHNAITPTMRAALIEAITWASETASVRAVVLRGEGKSFCAGQDMRSSRPAEPAARIGIWRRESDNLAASIATCSVPVVAALHGSVLGRGLDIALAADLRVASEDTRLGAPEIKHGMVLGGGGARRLVRAIGEARAMEMLLCGETVEARTALAWGLVTRVVPPQQLDQEARSLASSLAALPDLAAYATRTVVRHSYDAGLQAGSWTDTALNVLLAAEKNKASQALRPQSDQTN